jgi:cobalt-zinc-cadmium efflux system outer membrane protein
MNRLRLWPIVLAAVTLAVSGVSIAQTPSAVTRPVAFDELRLDRATAQALEHSPDVTAANAVVAENAAALSIARATLGPSLVSSYNLSPQANPTMPSTISQRLTSVGLSATLGDAVAYAPNVAAANAALRSAQASLQAARRSERIRVIGLYYEALKALAIARAREEAVRVAQRQQTAAALRVRAGDAPRLDAVRAEVTLARAIAADALATAAMQNAAQALRVETGSTAALLTTVDGPVPQARDLSPEDAAATALRTSPDLRAAQASTASARSAAASAGLATLPSVTLGAGYARGNDSGVEVSGPTVNVGLAFPLGGGVFAGAAQKRALAAEAQAKEAIVARQLLLDVSAAARNASAAHRATLASMQARAAAQAEFDAVALGYTNGVSSSLELAAAQDTLGGAIVDELTSLYDELKAREILNTELGS